MKNKDVEEYLIASLEDKSSLGNNVLESAKNKLKESKSTKRSSSIKYVAIACAIVIVCLAIVLPIVFTPSLSKQCEFVQFSAMKDYFTQKNIAIKTYDGICVDGSEIGSGDCQNSTTLYTRISCELIKYKDKDFCINESYRYIDGSEIRSYFVVGDYKKLEREIFSQFDKLNEEAELDGIVIKYDYDSDLKIGKAKFVYDDCKTYMLFGVQSKEDITFHLQKFINLQQN